MRELIRSLPRGTYTRSAMRSPCTAARRAASGRGVSAPSARRRICACRPICCPRPSPCTTAAITRELEMIQTAGCALIATQASADYCMTRADCLSDRRVDGQVVTPTLRSDANALKSLPDAHQQPATEVRAGAPAVVHRVGGERGRGAGGVVRLRRDIAEMKRRDRMPTPAPALSWTSRPHLVSPRAVRRTGCTTPGRS